MNLKSFIFEDKGIDHNHNYDELLANIILISALLEYNLFFNPHDYQDKCYGFYSASYI
jgi:hypothetical protein